jgi:hypothetical protein
LKRRRADPKSGNQLAALALIERLLAVRGLVRDVDHRGILRVLEEAQLGERDVRTLVDSLGATWKGLRGHVIRIGDDRRARGQSVPLGWLPEGTDHER